MEIPRKPPVPELHYYAVSNPLVTKTYSPYNIRIGLATSLSLLSAYILSCKMLGRGKWKGEMEGQNVRAREMEGARDLLD